MTGQRDNLAILKMVRSWTTQTTTAIEDAIQRVEQARAERGEETAGDAEVRYPPCPICGGKVTSYEFNSDGPAIIEFQPCGSKVVWDDVEDTPQA